MDITPNSNSNTVTDTVLMDTIRDFRVIYDRGCTDFKNKEIKSNAWKEVSKKLNNMDISTLMKRYDNIRTVFGRYLKSVKPPSGSGREDVSLDKKYESLRWLVPYIKHREGTTTNVKRKLMDEASDEADAEQDELEINENRVESGKH